MEFDFVIEPLGRNHIRDEFDCGEASLNEFLRKYARQNSERGLGRTFVAVRKGSSKVVGYYTLSSGSVTFESVPEKLPRYPVPTAHLGRLAVDTSFKGLGLGEFLLIDALRRIVAVAGELGIYAVEVRALSTAAKSFYLRYGFVELTDESSHLYLPVRTILKLDLS